MGLIAHPDKITSISSTNDGKYFFSSGSDDYCVNIWSVNVSALEQIFASKIRKINILSISYHIFYKQILTKTLIQNCLREVKMDRPIRTSRTSSITLKLEAKMSTPQKLENLMEKFL